MTAAEFSVGMTTGAGMTGIFGAPPNNEPIMYPFLILPVRVADIGYVVIFRLTMSGPATLHVRHRLPSPPAHHRGIALIRRPAQALGDFHLGRGIRVRHDAVRPLAETHGG